MNSLKEFVTIKPGPEVQGPPVKHMMRAAELGKLFPSKPIATERAVPVHLNLLSSGFNSCGSGCKSSKMVSKISSQSLSGKMNREGDFTGCPEDLPNPNNC